MWEGLANGGDDNLRAHRLEKYGVEAGFGQVAAVVKRGSCGNGYDRQVARGWISLQRPYSRTAIHDRHGDIEQDNVWALGLRSLHAVGAVVGEQHAKPRLLERGRIDDSAILVVIDQQNGRLSGFHLISCIPESFHGDRAQSFYSTT